MQGQGLAFCFRNQYKLFTDDGAEYKTGVLEAMYDEKFTISPDDVEVEVI